MTSTRLIRTAAAVTAGVLMTGFLGGCSMLQDKGSTTTCQQFAEMSDHTGLGISASDDQTDVIDSMLSAHDKSTDATNEMLAYTRIIAYCNIYEGQSGSNQDKTVDNIPGLD